MKPEMIKTILSGGLLLALFAVSCKKDEPEDPYVPFVYSDSITDIDGNVYHTVTINGSVWTAENLRTTRYSNGDTIEYVSYISDWSLADSGVTCAYDNAAEAESIYGRMYNQYVITDPRGIAPAGWHVPTNYEWLALVSYLGTDAGNKLREHGTKHWLGNNSEATDEFGFRALPGGDRDFQGFFEQVRTQAFFWSSTYYMPSLPQYPEAWVLRLIGDQDPVAHEPEHFLEHYNYVYGGYIRLIKD